VQNIDAFLEVTKTALEAYCNHEAPMVLSFGDTLRNSQWQSLSRKLNVACHMVCYIFYFYLFIYFFFFAISWSMESLCADHLSACLTIQLLTESSEQKQVV
jgi:hypothetical protein